MKELDVELAASMFELTQQKMELAGLPAYEISNHAKPGEESRHNLVYWRYGDYLGVGPGAHGRLTVNGQRIATETAKSPEAWLQSVSARGDGLLRWDGIEAAQQGTERLLMGLRLKEGVELSKVESELGRNILRTRIDALRESGFIKLESGRLATTPKGSLVLNAVLKELLA